MNLKKRDFYAYTIKKLKNFIPTLESIKFIILIN